MTGKIPKNPRVSASGRIPNEAALIKGDDVEAKPFHFSYENYKTKLCGIADLKNSPSKRCLKDMVTIGSLTNIDQFKGANIDYKPITNSGDYKKLYNGLPVDVDIREHKIGKTERIFYYKVGRMIFIVAIISSHFETNKQRR